SYAERKLGDFFFIERKEPEEALRTIKLLLKERIPQRFGFHPLEDIQVITPMYRGVLGVNNLNLELQALLNPSADIYLAGMHRFRIGDKVIQLKNNYDKEVFNGDIGFVETIDREFQLLKVRMGGRLVEYEAEELDQLTLAYAISVHKSQGSEYKAVIIPIHHQHYIMLQRNLLYTAITRARRLVCLVGTKQAIAIAVRNDKQRQRYSALACWLAQQRHPEL
ncbi:MAG: ATP-binding domain-containing protein, partial [Candidatus Sumerlaeia bacterium]|nr:ATP-binding domain-containing protein [Candidatus Sumerlaeia bacterium]